MCVCVSKGTAWPGWEDGITESWNGLAWKGPSRTSSSIILLTLPLEQLAPSSIDPGSEHFQGWGIRNFCGQPVPYCSHREDFIFF